MRQWSQEECYRLFDDYFGPLPGICPVCFHEVRMVMSYLGRFVTLSLSCDACRNKANVSRAFPLDKPLHAARAIRLTRLPFSSSVSR
jgi:hypothetical protein